MREPVQHSTSSNMPCKESTMQHMQKDQTLRITMHSKSARKENPRRQQLAAPGQYTTPQTRRLQHVKSENQTDESIEESVDSEAALYMKELHEDWAYINLIRPTELNPQTNDQINKS